jgi:hypothetical protein
MLPATTSAQSAAGEGGGTVRNTMCVLPCSMAGPSTSCPHLSHRCLRQGTRRERRSRPPGWLGQLPGSCWACTASASWTEPPEATRPPHHTAPAPPAPPAGPGSCCGGGPGGSWRGPLCSRECRGRRGSWVSNRGEGNDKPHCRCQSAQHDQA